MSRRVESLERDAKNSSRSSWNSNNKSYMQKNSSGLNGIHQDPPPDPMVLDKLHMRIEALERELEKERHTTSLLKEDKEQLKAAVTDLQLRENDRMQNGFSIGDSSSPAVSASMAAEISQLKSALDSARKERQVLEEDRKRERKMFMENNARGESTRVEMMELRKNFDDMQAAVLQLQHELKLRNESIADLQQQLIFFQNLDKKRSTESNRHAQKSAVVKAPGGGGESPVYECSRCHQYFKDMPEFQEHITKCLEFRLFHSNNRRSKSVEPLTQDSSQTDLNRQKPSPFPSSNLNSAAGPNSQSSAILTKYSYDNLRSAGLTNSSSQLKITAIDSRHESRPEERSRANSVAGGVNSKLNRRVGAPQKGGNQSHGYDPDRSRAVSTPHLPSHQKQNSIESSSVGGFESDYSYNSGNNLNISTEPEIENEDAIEPVKVAVKELPELQPSSGGKVMSFNSKNEPFDDLIKPEVSLSVSAPKSMSSPIAQMVSKNQFNEQRNFNPHQNHERLNSYGRNNNPDRNFNQSQNYPAPFHERESSYGRGNDDNRNISKNQSYPAPIHQKQNSYGQQNRELQDNNSRMPIRGKSSGFSVTRMKSPEEQPAPEIFKISSSELNSSNPQQRPLDVRPDSTSLEMSDNNMLAKTRHSPTISSSSSDGVREASINLRAEMRSSRDEPDSSTMRNSIQPRGASSGGFRESMLSPAPVQPSLERNPREDLLSPVQRERIPREDLLSPSRDEKTESDMELVYENAANAARQKFLEASKPGLALQEKLGDRGNFRRPPPPNAQRSSLPPEGSKPAWERQPLQRPGFVPIQQPSRLSASSDMRSPTNDAILEHPVASQPGRDSHPMRQPLGPGRRSEPFTNDADPRNGFVSDESVPLQPDNNRNSLMSPTVPHHQSSKSDAERNPAFNFNEESLKSPVSRRSITFDPKEKPKNPKSRTPTTGPPNSILRNASKGIQVIDNTGSDGEALEIGADVNVGIGGRDQVHQNFESDSNSSVKYHPDKENTNSLGRPKKNERSKSPSLKNFRNRFFSNSDDKKEKEKDKDKSRDKKLQDKKGLRQPMVPQQPHFQVPPPNREDFHDDANYPRRESEGDFRGRPGIVNNGSYRGRSDQQHHPPRQGPMRPYDRPQLEREGMGRESGGGGGGDGNRGRPSMQSQPQFRPQFSAEMRQGMPTTNMQYRGGPRARSQPPAQHQPSGGGRGGGGNNTVKQQNSATVSTDV
ncbi:uncharacterized protein LOC142336269 isoform X2 [Convolutriloba macropyga]